MQYPYLLFDLDHTLWDFHANSSEALSTIFREYSLDQYFSSPGDFIKTYNHHNDILWDLYRKGSVSKEQLRIQRFEFTLREKGMDDTRLMEKIGAHYMEITPKLNILANNTIETLEYLAGKNYQMYILTNGFLATQVTKMAHSNIDRFFKKIFSSEELGVSKPHREFFHWAVSSLHAHKDACLMIGDDLEVDVKGAMNYGIDAVWYNPAETETNYTPTYTIHNMKELTSIL